jgi:hypothetical protein
MHYNPIGVEAPERSKLGVWFNTEPVTHEVLTRQAGNAFPTDPFGSDIYIVQGEEVKPRRGQIPDRGRPTARGDEIPVFDYDAYFPGTWEFEWRVPESPLGSGGMIEGTEVYAPSEDGQ